MQTAACLLCNESVSVGSGVTCRAPSAHFVCNCCFDNFVNSQLSADAQLALAQRDWRLQCVMLADCSSDVQHAYSQPEVLRHVNKATRKLWLDTQARITRHAKKGLREEKEQRRQQAKLAQQAISRCGDTAAEQPAKFEKSKRLLVASLQVRLSFFSDI